MDEEFYTTDTTDESKPNMELGIMVFGLYVIGAFCLGAILFQ